jgi:hypothetical protein
MPAAMMAVSLRGRYAKAVMVDGSVARSCTSISARRHKPMLNRVLWTNWLPNRLDFAAEICANSRKFAEIAQQPRATNRSHHRWI